MSSLPGRTGPPRGNSGLIVLQHQVFSSKIEAENKSVAEYKMASMV
jgi:hypothetical protein